MEPQNFHGGSSRGNVHTSGIQKVENFKAADLKQEDLAKLPKGPREFFLSQYPPDELIRLAKSETTQPEIQKSLQDPSFWITRLKEDQFLLPNDILDLAKRWKNKDQTEADFLMSFYVSIEIAPVVLFHRVRPLLKELRDCTFYASVDDILQKVISETELLEREVLTREEDIIALLESGKCYLKRKNKKLCTFKYKCFGKLSDDFPLDQLGGLVSKNLSSGIITTFLPDPLTRVKLKFRETMDSFKQRKLAEEKLEKEDEFDDEGEEDEYDDEQWESLALLSDPEFEFLRERCKAYFELLPRLVKEGDIFKNGGEIYIIYQDQGTFKAKRIHDTIPKEWLPFMKRNNISSRSDVSRVLEDHISKIEIPEKGIFRLGYRLRETDGERPIFSIEYEGHTIYVKSLTPVEEKGDTGDTCLWISKATPNRPGGQCNRPKSANDRYFCKQHSMAATKDEQIKRINSGK